MKIININMAPSTCNNAKVKEKGVAWNVDARADKIHAQ